jgi:hypothetical protein
MEISCTCVHLEIINTIVTLKKAGLQTISASKNLQMPITFLFAKYSGRGSEDRQFDTLESRQLL